MGKKLTRRSSLWYAQDPEGVSVPPSLPQQEEWSRPKRLPGNQSAALGYHLLACMLYAVLVLFALLSTGLMSPLAAQSAASLDAAVTQVEQSHGGRILSARSEQRATGVVFVIRVLTDDQQVRHIEIPAQPGVEP